MKKKLLKKLVSLERDVSLEKGGFCLFAVFVREDTPYGHWDLVASAPWLEPDKKETFNYFVEQLKAGLDTEEFLSLSVMAFIPDGDPRLEDIYEDVEVEHGIVEVVFRTYFDMDIKHAYIITSKRENALANTVTARRPT